VTVCIHSKCLIESCFIQRQAHELIPVFNAVFLKNRVSRGSFSLKFCFIRFDVIKFRKHLKMSWMEGGKMAGITICLNVINFKRLQFD